MKESYFIFRHNHLGHLFTYVCKKYNNVCMSQKSKAEDLSKVLGRNIAAGILLPTRVWNLCWLQPPINFTRRRMSGRNSVFISTLASRTSSCSSSAEPDCVQPFVRRSLLQGGGSKAGWGSSSVRETRAGHWGSRGQTNASWHQTTWSSCRDFLHFSVFVIARCECGSVEIAHYENMVSLYVFDNKSCFQH